MTIYIYYIVSINIIHQSDVFFYNVIFNHKCKI